MRIPDSLRSMGRRRTRRLDVTLGAVASPADGTSGSSFDGGTWEGLHLCTGRKWSAGVGQTWE